MPLLYSNCLDLWSSKERVWSDVLMDINIMRLWVSMIFNQKGIILTKSYVGPQKGASSPFATFYSLPAFAFLPST